MADFQGPNMSREWNLEIGQAMLDIIREAKAKGFQPIVTCKFCERQVRRDLAFKTPEGEFICEECDKE